MIAALGEGAGDHVDILIWSMIEGSLIRDRHEMAAQSSSTHSAT